MFLNISLKMETVMQADSYPSDPIMAGRNKTLEST